ncbi:hypothetical protein R5R35_009568 [Gryllus longicercus]|uniref:Carboxypeptidase n=1 Tax=Gryllus longicercus TaxID=2509291 RepID=A0AAN9Z642_9ORTH
MLLLRMKLIISPILLVLICVHVAVGVFNPYPKIKTLPIPESAGKPLILTPLIESGKIAEARKESRVLPLFGDRGIESYSGYFTVNKNFNSNLFFWFFPSQGSISDDPVILWLQGGPGASSLYGLFEEHGPFIVDKSGSKLLPRKYSWIKQHNVIYIDNPVGTGYSFTDGGYAKNETAVGNDLYSAVIQFFKLFPELQSNPFFVTGESYAGKYVPALSYTIHTKNPNSTIKINLNGLAMGNGLSDPLHMLKYADYVYQLGLIDSNTCNQLHVQEDLGQKYMENKQWAKAYEVFEDILAKIGGLTGFSSYYNYLYANGESFGGDFSSYIQQSHVREAIHVGNAEFHDDRTVGRNLMEDFMQSVKPWIEELLEHYRVLVYNGQLDIIVAYPLTVSYLNTLHWSSAAEYKIASRFPWHVGKDIAGYVKTAGNLTEVLVRDAGHMVPSDQPKWALDLIGRFTSNKPFH